MLRAVPCSSSGGQIVLLQHLVSSLPHRKPVDSGLQSALNRHTVLYGRLQRIVHLFPEWRYQML